MGNPTFVLDIGRTMKVIILCLLLGTTLGAPGGPTFQEFEEEQHEKFMDPEEEAVAAEEFATHEAQVEENNADYEAGNSNFFEEVYAKYDRASIPATWDSRAKGWVSAVKNQGACGSCAAFAAVGAAESSLLKAGAARASLDLSEQWLVDCKPANANGCNGASLSTYQQHMASTGNLMHENERPYKGSTTFQCPSGPYWSPGYKIT